ncbi:DNA helicase related protein [Caldimonas brevitalea]|uniref:DNA helicase related protein n=2 Tax=Caldimonas brevitalea TaxID=413882 RepID=A0A0G3BN57_9BURK|nr:DNA helicase related protein [Caldimonas brevitalea]
MDRSKVLSEPQAPSVHIELTLVPKLNLADFQNAIPALRELAVVNNGDEPLTEVDLCMSSQPPFLKPCTWRIESIAPGQRYRIVELDLGLDGVLLSRLIEAERAIVSFSLQKRREGRTELARREVEVELLPRNQWGGLAGLPDMVAAFVQPNDPAVGRVLKQAAEVLRKADRHTDIDGYRGGARRAWELASAIWSAVGALHLDYALPPASFEHKGQKVRDPSQIAEAGLATCLDLALLFCAALEQAGLHPVLVFTEGHALAGLWLQAEEFNTSVVDDVTALRKRVKLKELVLFETTLVTQRPLPPFSYAIERGAQQVGEERAPTFELAVDIRRARLQRIKPLATARAEPPPAAPGLVALPPPEEEPPFEAAPELLDDRIASDADLPEGPEDRLGRWQRKLLDLSLRNNLLSFKMSQKALKLEAPDPGRFEDLLATGQAVKLLPRPELMDGQDPRDPALHESRERENLRRQHALDALQRSEVFVGLPKDDLEARLVELYRAARASLQEGGSNTLYLAMGFLSWARGERDERRFKAPLVLVPVSLERKSVRSGFRLKLHDDEARFNPTLLEMLRQDFKLSLGVQDAELPRDDSGLDITGVWKKVSAAIKDIKGWEVVEDVVLSTFSFAKYLMWKDLSSRTEQLKQNPVVRHLIETPREPFPSTVAFPDPRRLDQELAPRDTFCPLPADSSQLSAVVAAKQGKDFVLIGPPGTGKSQTIANLIAQCLAEGKRVLFVSEKMAALDVVWRRLRDVGLGEFCLELHSSKARKAEVLEQLRRAWNVSAEADPLQWQAEAERLGALRDRLNGYVERLHRSHPNGLSVHQAIGRVLAGQHLPTLQLAWPDPTLHDGAALAAFQEAAELLDVNAEAVGAAALAAGPWHWIGHGAWSPSWQAKLLETVRGMASTAQGAEAAALAFTQAVGWPTFTLERRVREGLLGLAEVLPRAAGRNWRFTLRADARALAEDLQRGARLVTQHRELRDELPLPWDAQTTERLRRGVALLTRWNELASQITCRWSAALTEEFARGVQGLAAYDGLAKQLSLPYGDAVAQLDAAQLQRDWQEAEQSVWPLSGLRHRALARRLKSAASGGGEPDVGSDIQRLAKLRALQAEIETLDALSLRTGKIWAGLQTRRDVAHAALAFQASLPLALAGQPWDEAGLEPAAEGACGPGMAEDLRRLREMRSLAGELERLGALDLTVVWAGHDTDLGAAAAALALQAALAAARDGQPWRDEGYAAVEDGRCGPAAAAALAQLRQLQGLKREIDTLNPLSAPTGGLWAGLQTRTDEVEAAVAFHAALSTSLAKLASTPEALAELKAPLEPLLGEGNMLLESSGPVAVAAQAWRKALQALHEAMARFTQQASMPQERRVVFAEQTPAALALACRQLLDAAGRLHVWCAWRGAREQALALGLTALVGGLEQGTVSPGQVREVFETDYCRWWLNAVVDRDEVLRGFVSAVHEKRIRDFQALDERFIALTREGVRARLCASLPVQDSVAKNSDWGLLRYEMQKKTRHLPLRELMRRAPEAILTLTPCLLMSPLSIAHYLSAETANFDVVVFDEASQIPVWDAIGAMARGRQVVMVGDPKQLPPTHFFDRAESDDDDDVELDGDLESILDECIGASLPTMHLSWHYRSRHESLIAFSNRRYYRGELVTFPSPVTQDRSVSFHHVGDGVYDKGGSRTNQPEAQALVRDLVDRLKSPGFRESGLTVGVVTFNVEQQSLVEDLLDEERRKDPTIESFFAEDQPEPVFVKNLESVQGDERDIMYFSITYGPGAGGAVSMNFGPMNRQGGERRLNVAITRARHELRVFSSLRPEQMDLSRTASIGVRDLKHFMEFAERGAGALEDSPQHGSTGEPDGLFEQMVARALRDRGWRVRAQVGVSAFKIDLAVVDPDAPDRYLAGIECDGATYRRSATARDRDKLREQVLRSLGWDTLRLWSTDWWIDPDGTLEKVHRQLQALLRARRAGRELATPAAL